MCPSLPTVPHYVVSRRSGPNADNLMSAGGVHYMSDITDVICRPVR